MDYFEVITDASTGEQTIRLYTPEEIATAQAAAQAATSSARIAELKQLLASTDYVALADYDKSKPEVLAQRQAWREELRTLEAI
jgi:RES domain-containing protein